MSIQVAGKAAIVFGQNRAHARSVVKQACQNAGWMGMINRPPSQATALQEAIKAVARDTIVAPNLPLHVRNLRAELSFEAVRTKKGDTRNDAIHVLSAAVDDTHVVQLLSQHSMLGSELLPALQAAYDQRRDLMSPSQVGCAVRGAVRRLGGVQLGGHNLYYLNADSVGRFAQWRDEAQLLRYNMVSFEVASDPQTVKHIISALQAEVQPQTQLILDEINAGLDEARRIKVLRKKCQSIVAKILSYEKALGQQLDWMREPLLAAENALAISSLLEVSV